MKRIPNHPEQGTTTFEVDGLNDGDFVKSRCLITSVRVTSKFGHDHVSIWNRGARTGELIFNQGDGERVAELLLNENSTRDRRIAELVLTPGSFVKGSELNSGMTVVYDVRDHLDVCAKTPAEAFDSLFEEQDSRK